MGGDADRHAMLPVTFPHRNSAGAGATGMHVGTRCHHRFPRSGE